jgi:hypothetical protein
MPLASSCFSFLFLFILLMVYPLCADTAAYKTRAYTPSKTASQKTFEAKDYQSSKSRAQRSYETEKPYATDLQKNQKNITNRPFESSKERSESKPAEHALYTPSDRQTTISTMSANPAVVNDEKPFESQTGALESKVYKASEKKPETNPLLRPKQGIKEQGEKQQ